MKLVSLILLYLLRLCGSNDQWGELRRSNPTIYSTARKLQRMQVKRLKCELDIQFLKQCLHKEIIPKFARSKSFKSYKYRKRLNEQKRVLRHSLNSSEEKYNSLKKSLLVVEKTLRMGTTILKFALIIALIKLDEDAFRKKTLLRHNKKMRMLLDEKMKIEGKESNPNKLVVNLTDHVLTEEEVKILRLGLNYSVALRPKEPHLLAEVESLWDQITKKGLLKYKSHEARVKTALRAFAFSYLDLDDSRFGTDTKQIRILKTLRERFAILKPDKGNGVVLINKSDYVTSMKSIFDNKSKFREVKMDNSITLVSSLQNYLNTLLSRSEITSDEKSAMRTMSAVVSRAHGLPKIHKKFDLLPKFRPIIDTTATAYARVGRFLSTLLQPLTFNEFSLKDSFDAAEKINCIPRNLLNEGYKFVSFDVVSLFTNVPLDFTVNVILDRVYNHNVINTNLSKRSLKKLILDSCRKTIFHLIIFYINKLMVFLWDPHLVLF